MEAFRFINCSVDPDGEIVSWHWDFGDGTTSTDPEPVHQYERVGTYIVTLTVTDNDGATSTRVRDITVCRRPLIIAATAATKTYGDLYGFAGTEFSVEGLVGDDSVTSVALVSDGAPARASVGDYAIVPSSAAGIGLANYDIIYRDGTLKVTRRPLIITAADATKTYGGLYEFTGTEFSVEGLVGDDSVARVTLASDGAPADAAAGTYSIVIVAGSPVGIGLTNYDITYRTGTLRVYAPPVACFTWEPDCPKEGEPFQLMDCSTDADGEIVSWSWDFRDGTTSTDRHPTAGFGRAGTYTVTLVVTDNDGLSDTVSHEIAICEALGTLSVTPGPGLLASPKSLLLVVDASQSMEWWLGRPQDRVVRMDAAKAALRELVAEMPDQLNVGLLVYYNCDRIELVVPIGRLDRTRLLTEIEAIVPTGATPIGGALEQAADALGGHPGPSLVLLVSDGEETCGGQPVQAARALATSGLDLRIDVIGLAVEDEPEVVQQLRDIAAAGSGTYFSAESTDALLTALRLAAPVMFSVYDADEEAVAAGVVGDPAVTLRAGQYTVVIETALGKVSVEAAVFSDKETRVEVEYKDGTFRALVL
jgi:PKD repeat protein